jgi:hypothetical protein
MSDDHQHSESNPREFLAGVAVVLLAISLGAFAWSKYRDLDVRHPTPLKTVINNLRPLATAAQTYMMDKEVTQAAYTDLVGAGTDKYVHHLIPVMDEHYTSFLMVAGQSRITLSSAYFGTVTYNM